jgi:uncharacterized protein YbaR (Trm112 family)
MKSLILDLLICPACLPEEKGLVVDVTEKEGEDILSGSLTCDKCGMVYHIRDGIASLLPRSKKSNSKTSLQYESPALVSSYLWSHYADIFGDRDAGAAYQEWAQLLSPKSGCALDAGCSVGRFAFEMSNKCDLVVGIDNSRAFVQKARELMKVRRLSFQAAEEGTLMEGFMVELPESWESDRTEFIMGDVEALPFRSGIFSSLASLNLIDKVPIPLRHLGEINRVSSEYGAQLLISDPFSWSLDAAREEDWLGGTRKGAFSGKGIDNVRSLLTGDQGDLTVSWKVAEEGHVWWKIRNHRNHFELIRSCFIKAVR